MIFYGVRGSIPAPGQDTVRYGGNTSCVAVRSSAGDLLILDSGTGIIALGRELLAAQPFCCGGGQAAILLSHAHWDHIQGFPFFSPIFVQGNRFTVLGPARSSSLLEGVLEGQVNPHFSPLYTMKNLGASFDLLPMEECSAPACFGGVTITCCENPHGATTCLAYCLEEGGRRLIYAPDAGYLDEGPGPGALALYQGADLLIHDATYTPADRKARLSRGYSSYIEAAEAAVRCGARHLVLFHYDQDYTDDQIDEMRLACRQHLDATGGAGIEVTAASEGLRICL